VGDAARSESVLPVQAVCGADALDGFDPDAALGVPGGFPFTRGVGRLPTARDAVTGSDKRGRCHR
jgi:hypothetical protein